MKAAAIMIFSRPEQRAIVIEALKVFPNVWVVYQHLGKLIGISYGTVWNIAKAEGIKLIRKHALTAALRGEEAV